MRHKANSVFSLNITDFEQGIPVFLCQQPYHRVPQSLSGNIWAAIPAGGDFQLKCLLYFNACRQCPIRVVSVASEEHNVIMFA
jgi:hypothetical protein